MKKIYLIPIVTTIFIACSNELDLAPISTPSAAGFFNTSADIETAVNGAYDGLQQRGMYGQSLPFLFEVRSDNSEESSLGGSGGIFSDIDLFSILASNSVLADTWGDSYNTIQRCNIILNRIDGIGNMDDVTKEVRKGEVQFIRALTYFNLVRIFGDVPLVIEETVDPFEGFGKGRDPASTVYTQIVNDLTAATNSLPTSHSVVGKATKGAAFALLGKVYLTLGNHSEAIAALGNVTGYSLVANYADLFGEANENNSESIFEVQYTAGSGSTFTANGAGSAEGEGSAYANLFAPFGGGELVVNGSSDGSNRPTADLWNSYDATDLRRDINIGQFGTDNVLYPKKLVAVAAGPLDSGVNAIVLRYADVLLMHAEALNEQGYVADGEAFTLLNQIRSRAGLPNLTSADAPDQTSFRLAVENERRWELAFEGHRWPDLLRTNRALEVMQNHTTETAGTAVTLSFIGADHLLYPIPQNEIDTNPALVQNPGY